MVKRVPVAVILDLVDSRAIPERSSMQVRIEEALNAVNDRTRPVEPLAATVGDEFQAVYATVADALEATLVARLSMPEPVDCRFGIGRGEIRSVGTGLTGIIQDGPGWWSAREAIDEAHQRADTRVPSLRSWFRDAEPGTAAGTAVLEASVNAYLLSRDHVVSQMSGRERRLALGTWLGRSQASMAKAEQISQSAVSQSIRRSGVTALQAGIQSLRDAELRDADLRDAGVRDAGLRDAEAPC
ncbi:SatD family protein [Subtercola boreus]|uniref:SatD family protein n=1 Tax=Subtercola boreus TaxID=120213 RepID=A0A3E0WA30_9MICO|nr:SatD family protein [Subtercola boreus]RFA20786.1 hypothetical protein B7R24_08435 [Subtercola boreus]RFA20901.1 hypothetical protein B7R23_08375 [Subtercola boreus]RFA27094.1 hypothetical protein B7R25_08500 [Subtercola boreus]